MEIALGMKTARRKYDILLEVLWLSAIFLIPLFFWPYVSLTFELPKVVLFKAITWLMIIVYCLKSAREQKIEIPVFVGADGAKNRAEKFLIFVIIGYFCVYLFATIFSVSPLLSLYGSYYRMQGLLMFFHYFAFALIIFLNLRTTDQILRLVKVFVISVFIASAIGILQKFVPAMTNFWQINSFLGRIFGTMGHPNYLADLIIMALPFSVGFLFLKKNRIFYALISVIIFLALIWTLGRASLLGFLISMMIFFIAVLWTKGRRRAALSLIAVPLIFAGMIVFANIYKTNPIIKNTPVASRFILAGENLRSIETRLIMWPAALRQISDRPILGYGPDTFVNTYQKYADSRQLAVEDFSNIADKAHNIILDTAVSSGLMGVIFYLSVLAALAVCCVKFLKSGAGMEKKILALCVTSSTFALFTSNQFGFPTITHSFIFWALIAVFLILISRSRAVKEIHFYKYNYVRFGVTAAVALMTVFMIFNFSARPVFADYFYRKALEFSQIGDAAAVDMSVQYFDDAIRWNAQQNYYNFAYSNYLIGLADFGGGANSALELARDVIEKGARISNKYDGLYYFTLGKIEMRLGNPEKAYKNFEAASEFVPVYPYIYIEWGNAYYNDEKIAEAVLKYQHYLDISPKYYEWKADLESRSKEDQNKYRVFYKLNPGFNNVFILLGRAEYKAGNKNKALEYLKYADENLEKISTLSVIYGETGEKKKAIEILKNGLELFPDDELLENNLKALGKR